MLVTINTDASYYRIDKIGGYAFWISSNVARIQKSGKLKEATSSTDAEVKGIGNALHTLLHANLPDVHKIIINCDCTFAFKEIRKRAKPGTPGRQCFLLLQKLKDKYEIYGKPIHEFRHVKAHSGVDDARSFVNEWCDKEAKKWARKAINEKHGKLIFQQP